MLKLFLCLAIAVATIFAEQLQQYNVDPSEVSVIGLSSGAFFAVQMHVAFSSSIKGAGVISGGPYYCAQGSMMTALTNCMSMPMGINVNSLISTTDSWAANDRIDPTSNLAGSPVYLFHGGSSDTTVQRGVEDKLSTYYGHYKADVFYKTDLETGHGFVTENYGVSCKQSRTPFINSCGYDLAGEIIKKLYANVAPKSTALNGAFIEVDQSEFFSGGSAHGMNPTGWLYVPAACAANSTTCKLVAVFHGCQQNYNSVRDAVVRNAGYNEWADSNNIIVLYPQTGRGATNGCFDWWGDQGDKPDYAQRTGHHMSTVKRMLDRIVYGEGKAPVPPTRPPPPPKTTKARVTLSGNETWPDEPMTAGQSTDGPFTGECYDASNFAHVTAGRAVSKRGQVFAKGSDEYMGLYNIFARTKLRETKPGYFVIDNSC